VRAHLILCFRAEEKIDMIKEDGKTKIVPKEGPGGFKGWLPICEKNLPYELTASFLLHADAPGVPKPIKLQEQHRPLFPLDKPITEEAAARSPRGPDLAQTVPLRDSHMVFPHGRDEELVGAIVTVAYGVGSPMRFADARVNQFKLTPHPGGVVIIQCRVQCRPSEQQIGKLYLLQSRAVTLTIEPANQPRIDRDAA
jgi:hypothetical protein